MLHCAIIRTLRPDRMTPTLLGLRFLSDVCHTTLVCLRSRATLVVCVWWPKAVAANCTWAPPRTVSCRATSSLASRLPCWVSYAYQFKNGECSAYPFAPVNTQKNCLKTFKHLGSLISGDSRCILDMKAIKIV